MEKINEFRKALDVPIGKLSIKELVLEICHQPEYLADMYRLTFDEKIEVSWRAIWVCEKVSELHPDWFVPLQEEIEQRLIACTHEGSKRLFLSILYNIPVSTPLFVPLLNYCLDQMLSLQSSIGVQALAMRNAYRLCRIQPELLKELQLILENAELEFYSTGIKTTIRNTLKRIYQDLKK